MPTLVIEDVEYEFSFDFDLGEARLIKRYTGLTINALRTADHSDPDLMAAFIHIAFRRRNPELSDDQLEQRVNAVKLAKLDARETEEPDARPPASPTSPGEDLRLSTGESSSNGVAVSPETASLEISGLQG